VKGTGFSSYIRSAPVSFQGWEGTILIHPRHPERPKGVEGPAFAVAFAHDLKGTGFSPYIRSFFVFIISQRGFSRAEISQPPLDERIGLKS
jgi:hypothetical protein